MNLFYRVLLGVIFIPIILLMFHLGDWFLLLMLTVIVFCQSLELRKMFRERDINIPVFVLLFNIAFLISFAKGEIEFTFAVLLILILTLFGNELYHQRLKATVNTVTASFFLILYTSFMLAFVYFIRQLENGRSLIMCLMILIWVTDTAAYFSGIILGRKRNIFAASPKKSIAGFVGGFLGAIGGSFLGTLIWELTTIEVILLAISAGFFGQFGDLVESLIKRDFGVKDSSSLIPGHGGMLDRFDSLIIAAPVFYVIYRLISIYS